MEMRLDCGNRPHQAGDLDYCSCWSEGYSRGKEKALQKLADWSPDDHFSGCGCQLCTIGRSIVRKVLGESV